MFQFSQHTFNSVYTMILSVPKTASYFIVYRGLGNVATSLKKITGNIEREDRIILQSFEAQLCLKISCTPLKGIENSYHKVLWYIL